jgi:GT2 family glycosyltransferase
MSIYKNDKLPYIKEALESLYNQTKKADIYLQLDGIVPQEIERFLDRELEQKKIAYLGKREQNIGLAGSLNELLEVVLERGYKYIVRMDADDISVPDRLEKQVDFLEKHPHIQAVGGWIEEFNTDTKERQIVRYAQTSEDIKANLVKRNPLAHVTICFRNTFFDTISCYDTTKLNEDYDLWIRAFKAGMELSCIPDVVVKVRTNNAFFARRKDFKRAKEVMFLKIDVARHFGLGIKGYIYGMAHFVLFLLPAPIKRYLYKNMRD